MNEFDVTLCKFYDNEICFNEECMTKYCENYECIYKMCYKLKAENELYKQAHKTEQERRRKFEQCLDEIEKLQKELCRRCEVTFCGNTVCYEILQKIKEVRGNE